jgi:hypothetical protein
MAFQHGIGFTQEVGLSQVLDEMCTTIEASIIDDFLTTEFESDDEMIPSLVSRLTERQLYSSDCVSHGSEFAKAANDNPKTQDIFPLEASRISCSRFCYPQQGIALLVMLPALSAELCPYQRQRRDEVKPIR